MSNEFKCDCGVPLDGFPHEPYCDVGADPTRLNESFKRDPERWIEGYTTMNTENVRRRVLVASNGHLAH